MTSQFAPQDLVCPDPPACPVAVDQLTALAQQGTLPVLSLPTSRHWYRVYDGRYGYGEPNPGHGDTRFAPFDARSNKSRVPTMYLADTLEAALLETSFRDVHTLQPRVVSEAALLGKFHARLVPSEPLSVVDLRDHVLRDLAFAREQVTSSPSEHYPCTRQIAQAIHAAPGAPAGILWHSRQAELSGKHDYEAAIVFFDRLSQDATVWQLGPYRNATGALLEGAGRLLLDEVAESLEVTVIHDLELG